MSESPSITNAIILLQRKGAIHKDDYKDAFDLIDRKEEEVRKILIAVGYNLTLNRNELWARLDPTDEGRGLFNYHALGKAQTLLLFQFYRKYYKKEFDEGVVKIPIDSLYDEFSYLYEKSKSDEKKARKELTGDLNKLAKTKIIRLKVDHIEVTPLIGAKVKLEDLENYYELLNQHDQAAKFLEDGPLDKSYELHESNKVGENEQ